MKATAAVLMSPRQLEMREFELPSVSADDGLLRVEACGLCGTDYEQFIGHVDFGGPKTALIPGHEIIGTIVEIGQLAAQRWGVARGDRVVLQSSIPCGSCEGCRGAYSYCGKMAYGISVGIDTSPSLWGGYATHVYLHPNAQVHAAPKNVALDVLTLFNPLAAALTWTLDTAGVRLGTSVVIAGPGQRGLLAVFVAAKAGAKQIIVTGTKDDAYRLEIARQLGATTTINVDETDPVEVVKEITRGKLVDVALDMSNRATRPIVQAVEMVRRGGRIVLCGVKGPHPVEGLMSDRIVLKELTLVGVSGSTFVRTDDALGLIASHEAELAQLKPRSYPLSEVVTALQTLGREIYDPTLLHQHLRIG